MYIIFIIYDNVYDIDVFEAINESMRIIYESRDGKKMEQDSQTYIQTSIICSLFTYCSLEYDGRFARCKLDVNNLEESADQYISYTAMGLFTDCSLSV